MKNRSISNIYLALISLFYLPTSVHKVPIFCDMLNALLLTVNFLKEL